MAGADNHDLLEAAVQCFLNSTEEATQPEVLWSLPYIQRVQVPSSAATSGCRNVLELALLGSDLVLDDAVLEEVKQAWRNITGDDEDMFMKFEAREGSGEDEEAI